MIQMEIGSEMSHLQQSQMVALSYGAIPFGTELAVPIRMVMDIPIQEMLDPVKA